MAEENKRNLTDADLDKVSGGNGGDGEYQVMQTMICEFGHEWDINLSALEECPENAFVCPDCGTTNVRRKN
ncbi:MAG: hypothetical protein J5829_06205 [Lachnospiraceae bacterium]|nr:hypothetical protein [Lachnospiraceae bacterium]